MSRNDPTPTNYTDADALLHRNSDPRLPEINSRKIGNNTWLERRGDNIAARLHETDIVTWSPDGIVTFRTGGWDSTTTRERLNRYAPAGIGFAIRKGEMVVINQHTREERPMPDELILSLASA